MRSIRIRYTTIAWCSVGPNLAHPGATTVAGLEQLKRAPADGSVFCRCRRFRRTADNHDSRPVKLIRDILNLSQTFGFSRIHSTFLPIVEKLNREFDSVSYANETGTT